MGIETKTIVIGLDLSTKPGYAILVDGERLASGTSRPSHTLSETKGYPFNYVNFAEEIIESLNYKIHAHLGYAKFNTRDVNVIVVEETTASSQNYSQKILEFTHLSFLKLVGVIFPNAKVVYIRDGIWKSLTGSRMNPEEKKNNAKISRLKAAKKAKNPEKTRIIVRKDKDGNPVRKVTEQDAYIRAANETFGLKLVRENEDEAAALLVAKAYLMGAPICDGTVDGGLNPKKEESNG